MNRLDHYRQAECQRNFDAFQWKQKEAELEGFLSWDGLMRYFEQHKLNMMDLYRIEYELCEVEGDEKEMQVLRKGETSEPIGLQRP